MPVTSTLRYSRSMIPPSPTIFLLPYLVPTPHPISPVTPILHLLTNPPHNGTLCPRSLPSSPMQPPLRLSLRFLALPMATSNSFPLATHPPPESTSHLLTSNPPPSFQTPPFWIPHTSCPRRPFPSILDSPLIIKRLPESTIVVMHPETLDDPRISLLLTLLTLPIPANPTWDPVTGGSDRTAIFTLRVALGSPTNKLSLNSMNALQLRPSILVRRTPYKVIE